MRVIKFISFICFASIVFTLAYLKGIFNRLIKPPTTYSVENLLIDLGVPNKGPMFSVNDIKPGDKICKSFTVSNNGPKTNIGIKGIKTSESKNLSSVLAIAISSKGINIYGGISTDEAKTLSSFFVDSSNIKGIPLGIINTNETKTYIICIDFPSSAGNEYQASYLTFDIQVGGYFDIPNQCEGMLITGKIIRGTQKKDYLIGTEKNDLIFGYGGADYINGMTGDDCIISGEGPDTILGYDGADILVGELGNDIMQGNKGNDIMYGGENNDILQGCEENDLIYGENGDDIMFGNNGNDILIGPPGKDFADGGEGTDICTANNIRQCEQK